MQSKTVKTLIASLIFNFLVPQAAYAYDDVGTLVQEFSFTASTENPNPAPWPTSWPPVTADSGLLVSPRNVTPQIGIQWEGNAARIYVSGNRSVKKIEVRILGKLTTFVLDRNRPLVLDLPNTRPEKHVNFALINRNGTKKKHLMKLTSFSSCEELNKVFLGGISINGFVTRLGPDPTIAPSRAGEIFLANSSLDLDRDGIACER